MTPRNNIKLSPLELKAMEALWKLGRASIREILEQLPVRKTLAYTTVQTLVFRLEAKGAVRKQRKIGNAYVFVPVITRTQAYRRLVSDFLELFSGSPRPVMSLLVETGQLTLEDLRDLERMLKARKARQESAKTGDPKPE
ncbi:MAG: BlaI/MecI/CopY family transcriptional regulator [Acidobacteria bacterium]|nr:BlaI/MecI/CopY family transcriptional regulator [Acidobacteriota bacterium]